jgi:hypothetical protein
MKNWIYSDLHCHNHMRAHFQMQRRQRKFLREGKFSPWTVIPSNFKKNEHGLNSAAYSQTDLVRAWNAGLRLTFNSLYPLEREFVRGKKLSFKDNLLKLAMAAATSHLFLLRDLIQMMAMKIPKVTVDFFQSDEYDYWESFQREFEFVMLDSGKRITQNEIVGTKKEVKQLNFEKNPSSNIFKSYVAKDACYRIPKDKTELLESLSKDDEITMILTIEGAHALGSDKETPKTISKRIKEIKKDKEKWPVPMFFITFGHHFNNRLVGHAHSLPDKGNLIFDQSENMNAPIPEDGLKIIQELLGLDEQNNRKPELGYRILIDVKHMSAASRKDYYGKIVRPALMKGDTIPVIASHCGYSGRKTLQDHIDDQDLETDSWKDKEQKIFNAWNINVCDEDIKIILETKGLFGLSFDQRILGLEKKETKSPRNSIQLIWENLEGVIKAAYRSDLPKGVKDRIWNCMTIGTDFEGLIDPVNPYATVFDFPKLEKDLINLMDKERDKPNKPHLSFIQDRGHVVQIVRDFCYNNAEAFVMENYPV